MSIPHYQHAWELIGAFLVFFAEPKAMIAYVAGIATAYTINYSVRLYERKRKIKSRGVS